MPKYGNSENGPVSRKLLSVEQKISSILTPWGRKRVHCICTTSGTLTKVPKYGTFENRPISEKLLSVEQQAQFQPHGIEREYVQLLALWPMAKFHVQIWQF